MYGNSKEEGEKFENVFKPEEGTFTGKNILKRNWFLMTFQHYLTMLGSTITIPFILCPALCIEPDDPARGYIISTIFFVSGVVTLLQVTFGIR